MRLRFVYLFRLFALVLGILMNGCADEDGPGLRPPIGHECEVTITQGIWGEVLFWEGDFMPIDPSGTVTPVARQIFIYDATHFSMVEIEGGGFYSQIGTDMVTQAASNENGCFEVELEPGRYSVFVWENGLFYANGGDGQGFIYPVTVSQGATTRISFNIDYMATY